MENSLLVSSSPHLRGSESTTRIMGDVLIALVPVVLSGVYYFGFRSLLVILVTIASCVLSEYISRKVMKRDITLHDLSAVVTGLLLALSLPPSIPLWIAAVGGAVAIIIVKQMFGGLGQNFMNPALTARVMLMVSWTGHMTKWVIPPADTVSSATPLALIRQAGEAILPGYFELFVGSARGCIGETSVLALLLGGGYLLYRKVITFEIPFAFVGATALFTWIFGGDRPFTGDFIYHILSGSLIIGAFFMATDYSTSPMTGKGKLIMGVGCGLLTGVIRLYTNYPEGASFAIILMNILVPLIDRYTVPKSFGGEKVNA